MQGVARYVDLLAQSGQNRGKTARWILFRPVLAAGKQNVRIGRRLHD
jgi:hypothetical protein